MDIERLAVEFKSTLYESFPNAQEIDLKMEGSLIKLSFVGFTISIEKNTPNALEIVFRKAIETVKKLKIHLKKLFKEDEKIKYDEFKNACIRREKNAVQAALISSKVDFYDNSDQIRKKQKSVGETIDIPRNADDSLYLLSIIEDSLIKPQNDLNRNIIEVSENTFCNSTGLSDSVLIVPNINDCNNLDGCNNTNSCNNNLNVLNNYNNNMNSININNSSINNININNSNGIKFTDNNASNSLNELIDFVENPENKIQNASSNNLISPKLSDFIDKSIDYIFKGLMNIRSLDRVIKKAKSRGLFKNNIIQFDGADFSMLNTTGSGLDFNISQINTTNINDTSLISNSNVISNSSYSLDQSNLTLKSIISKDKSLSNIFDDLISNELSKDKINRYKKGRSYKKLANMHKSSPNRSNEKILRPSISNILKNGNVNITKPEIVSNENSLNNNIFEPATVPNNLFNKINNTQKDIINNPVDNKTEIDAKNNNNIPYSSYLAPLNTSMMYDFNDSKSSIQIKEQSKIYNDTNNTLPSTQAFKDIIIDCQDTIHGYIEIIRRFCKHYQINFPEFEIVRENDVFRCTACFLDINFVSGYEYDKQDAKNNACKKILEYISRNWAGVFDKK